MKLILKLLQFENNLEIKNNFKNNYKNVIKNNYILKMYYNFKTKYKNNLTYVINFVILLI